MVTIQPWLESLDTDQEQVSLLDDRYIVEEEAIANFEMEKLCKFLPLQQKGSPGARRSPFCAMPILWVLNVTEMQY